MEEQTAAVSARDQRAKRREAERGELLAKEAQKRAARAATKREQVSGAF